MNLRTRCCALLFAALAVPCGALADTPSCARSGASAQALADLLAGGAEEDVMTCASASLAALGAPAVGPTVALLETYKPNSWPFALATLEAMGPQAAAAIPGLVKFIRNTPFEATTHPQPAPVRDDDVARAVALLGKLGKHDPGTAVPVLLPLLDQVGYEWSAVFALGDIGRPAAAALPRLTLKLNQLISEKSFGQAKLVLDAVLAIEQPRKTLPMLLGYIKRPALAEMGIVGLSALGPDAAPAVPMLIRKLNGSRGNGELVRQILRTLMTVGASSLAGQEQLLIEATRHHNPVAQLYLSDMPPLPAHFGPPLRAALRRAPREGLLQAALDNVRR